MNNKNLTLYSIIIFLIIGLNSCSSDSEPTVTPITVTTADFTVSIDENPINGQVIGTVTGSTNQGSVTFSITEQTPSGAFAIDSGTGELTVINETLFAFEDNPTITGVVKVANGSVFENSNITIGVNDIYEANIFVGEVNLKTQEEVDAFGANNYTEITESLYVGDWGIQDPGNLSVIDLTPLSSLISIGENLAVGHNDALVTLAGLDNINSINGFLRIIDNDVLNDITALINIQNEVEELYIVYNNNLQTIDGLNNIVSVSTNLLIQANDSLENVDGLNNLTTVGEQFSITANYSLLNLDGFSHLTSVGANSESAFMVANNFSLTNIDGLNNLTTLPNGFDINDCPSLTNLDGFSNVTNCNGINISDCPALTNINGLNNITSTIFGLHIENNDLLVNLDPLINISPSVVSNLSILKNDSLINIDVLESITSVTEQLFIWQNSSLVNLDGLYNINYVGYDLYVTLNSTLSDLCGLQTLLNNNGLEGNYNVGGNAYNPSQQDIIDGNCSL